MRPGETSVISRVLQNDFSNKLLEMGFLPGAAVRFNFSAPPGDPVCVTVQGYDISLRMEEASCIQVL